MSIKLITYIVTVLLIFLLREQISLIFLKDASFAYLILAGNLLVALTFFSTFQFIVIGFQNFKLYALSNFLSLALSAILSAALSFFGIFYIILGWSLGNLIGSVFSIKFFFDKKIIKNIEEFDIRKIFWKFSIPMYLNGIINGLFSIIIPLLSLFFSQEKVGYFSFAFIFYFAALLIPGSIASVLFPKVSELNGLERHKDAKDFLKKAFKLYAAVAILGIIVVILFSDWIFMTFFKNYLPSLFMFKVITTLGLFFGFNTIYINYLQGLGKVKKVAILTLFQNALLTVISFILLIIS